MLVTGKKVIFHFSKKFCFLLCRDFKWQSRRRLHEGRLYSTRKMLTHFLDNDERESYFGGQLFVHTSSSTCHLERKRDFGNVASRKKKCHLCSL